MYPPPRNQISPDVRTSQLIVQATEANLNAIEALIKELDTPTRQILIEARLLETSQSPSSIKGIDWSGTLQAQHLSFGNGLTTASSAMSTATPGAPTTTTLPSGRTIITTPGSSSQSTLNSITSFGSTASGGAAEGGGTPTLGPGGLSLNTARGFSPNIAFLNADGVSAVLSFLNQDIDTEVVATPRAVTLDNVTAVLSVTRSYPIFQVTPGSANSPAGAQTTYTNVGTILTVTPRITGTNSVALNVVPEVSNIDGQDQQTVNGLINKANIYASRRVETHVVIPSGNTLVMGGLISDNTPKSYTKVPILGDLPLIGLLFRQDSKQRLKQNLLIFITPTIIQDRDFQQLPPSDFLTSKPRDIGEPFTAWDTGKPYDWKKSTADKAKD
ncbi:MAG: hypothetical protein M1608_07925 [Candidatus Omnitrophica bacterium]|nr:hypothetical protein [Candidatus Omnitrophota bacterium]